MFRASHDHESEGAELWGKRVCRPCFLGLTGLRLASCRGLLVTSASLRTRPCPRTPDARNETEQRQSRGRQAGRPEGRQAGRQARVPGSRLAAWIQRVYPTLGFTVVFLREKGGYDTHRIPPPYSPLCASVFVLSLPLPLLISRSLALSGNKSPQTVFHAFPSFTDAFFLRSALPWGSGTPPKCTAASPRPRPRETCRW